MSENIKTSLPGVAKCCWMCKKIETLKSKPPMEEPLPKVDKHYYYINGLKPPEEKREFFPTCGMKPPEVEVDQIVKDKDGKFHIWSGGNGDEYLADICIYNIKFCPLWEKKAERGGER